MTIPSNAPNNAMQRTALSTLSQIRLSTKFVPFACFLASIPPSLILSR
jgi:hypothetical protein